MTHSLLFPPLSKIVAKIFVDMGQRYITVGEILYRCICISKVMYQFLNKKTHI